MSVTPSSSGATPSLSEILIRRAFTRPPRAFVDRDFIEALTAADHEHEARAAAPTAERPGAAAARPALAPPATASPATATAGAAGRVDVRV